MGFRSRAFPALALALVAGSARADSSDLDWLGVVYVWAAEIGVDARDRSAEIEFSDVIDKLEMGFQGHVEAQADDYGGFVDIVFMGVGDNSSRPLADLNADYDLTAMDLALVWSPGPERMTGIELYGGLRYIDMDLGLVVNPLPPGPADLRTGIDSSYTDFLAGARYIAPLAENWRLTITTDLSGGDTEGTWSVGGYAGYRAGPHHFIAGYRHVDMELEASGGDKRVTQVFSGPLVAY